MWVYTEYAEECGHMDRKAGEPALLGYCFVDGVIAKEWEKKGYIRWEEAHQNESEKSRAATPTIDAVPVVRCKDCKRYYANGGNCDQVLADWFCADGKHYEGR